MVVKYGTPTQNSLVLQILTYGCEVWYPYPEQLTGDQTDTLFKNRTGNKQPHENAQFDFCRQTLGVHNKAMGIPVPSELGRCPISLKRVGQFFAFWAQVITSDVDSYARKLYYDMTGHQFKDKDQWLSFIILFQGLEMTQEWDNKFTFSADRLEPGVLSKLQDRFNQFWQKSKKKKKKKKKRKLVQNDILRDHNTRPNVQD